MMGYLNSFYVYINRWRASSNRHALETATKNQKFIIEFYIFIAALLSGSLLLIVVSAENKNEFVLIQTRLTPISNDSVATNGSRRHFCIFQSSWQKQTVEFVRVSLALSASDHIKAARHVTNWPWSHSVCRIDADAQTAWRHIQFQTKFIRVKTISIKCKTTAAAAAVDICHGYARARLQPLSLHRQHIAPNSPSNWKYFNILPIDALRNDIIVDAVAAADGVFRFASGDIWVSVSVCVELATEQNWYHLSQFYRTLSCHIVWRILANSATEFILKQKPIQCTTQTHKNWISSRSCPIHFDNKIMATMKRRRYSAQLSRGKDQRNSVEKSRAFNVRNMKIKERNTWS